MKSLNPVFIIFLLLCSPLKAQERIYERVFVYTDKDCYIAGEDIWVKFYLIDNHFQSSALSKVGYVEICDTQRPQIQLKVALEKGKGSGKVRIPSDVPTGMYELTGYTRYMRNEGENAFFKKQIAIVNVEQQMLDPERFEVVESFETIQLPGNDFFNEIAPAGLSIKTDQTIYGKRKQVALSLDNIPENTADLVVSVSRNDSLTVVPDVNQSEWQRRVRNASSNFSMQWLPEYEGHIITGRFVSEPQGKQLLSSISFVGKDIRYISGKVNSQNGTVDFYTAGIFGEQQIVTAAHTQVNDKVSCRVDLLSPFNESLPEHLPVLHIYPNEKHLIERYIGTQLQKKTDINSFGNSIQSANYYYFQPDLSYDLDQYTRFNTLSETILEFVSWVNVTRVGGSRRIRIFSVERQIFGLSVLVLLDGVPVYNHEDILEYNPMYIKMINIYSGRCMFGAEYYEGIVSFITHQGDLPFFQLSDEYQLFNYECPQLHPSLEMPDYSTDELRSSRRPDFRHTLYWNPSVQFTKGHPVNLPFYTSDLCGDFKITVEGITTDGKMIRSTANFQVKEP